MLEEDGYFLPNYKSRPITIKYLLEVYKNEVFRCLKIHVSNPPKEKKIWSNLDLLVYITQHSSPKKLGFNYNQMPDRNWLLTIAYSFNKDLEIFSGIEENNNLIGFLLIC